MGSCVSTNALPPQAAATSSSGDHPVGPTSAPFFSSALSASKRWRERKKSKKQRKEGEDGSEELNLVPGRMLANGSSETACLFTQQGKKGTNQDAMLVWENFTLRSDTIFCGVFDGHGPYGHMVARKVRDSLPLKLCTEWTTAASDHGSPHQNGSASVSMNSEESASISIEGEWSEAVDPDENVPEMYPTLKRSLLKAFKLMDKELKLHPAIDCFCSGTTAVTMIKQGHDLVIGNVGDSRAVLGTRDRDNNLVAVQLTVDLKPNLPREAARIQQCKGRVFALQDEPEVSRVWLPNSDSPGLAMARAFGDFCLKEYGLISVPDISYRHLTEKDEFIVLATDGVWDVLSNKEAVDIVASSPTHATAARALVECAVRAWRFKYPTSKTDDCAVVCLFLDPQSLPLDSNNKVPDQPTEPVAENITDPSVINNVTDVKREEDAAEGSQSSNPWYGHSHSLHRNNDSDEIVPVIEDPVIEGQTSRSQSRRSLADCLSTTAEEEWSALEGVTRVNSLLNIPRFLSSSDKRSTSQRRWQ